MARSVSRHPYSVGGTYINLTEDLSDDLSWDEFIEDLQGIIENRYPSLTADDRWEGRETHIIASNSRAEVGVSEYNGIVRVDIAPRDSDNPLDEGWACRVAHNFGKLLAKAYSHRVLVSQGTFSNGEQVFAPLNRPEGCVTSKEGVLW